MELKDILALIHPAIAVALVYPLIGMVVNLAWQTRSRRLQTAAEGKSKIPPIVGQEHLKLGRWLTSSVVGIYLIGLAYPIVFNIILKHQMWSKAPLQLLFIALMFAATIASLVFLYKARQRLWRGIFATLTGIGLIIIGYIDVILGYKNGIFRREYEWQVSHFFYGMVAALLMILSLAIVQEIYQDRSNRWRIAHTALNCAALLLFVGQGMTGSRDLLEIPLSWQQQHLYQCDWGKMTCPQPPQKQSQKPAPTVAAIPLGSGTFVTLTPGEDTSGTATIIKEENSRKVRLAADFSAQKGSAVKLLLHKQNPPQDYTADNSILLGDLKSFKGEQDYDIPQGIDWQEYPNVIVWCQKFNVTFGAAKLQKT